MSKVSDRHHAGVETDVPSAARIYDYALGGAHNFAADREAGNELFRVYPDGMLVARSNRLFLQRAVRYCYNQGVRQFLDLGSGIPTVGNVHEIAHQLDPHCRVVYVDNEAIAVATTRHMLADVPNAMIVDADMRDPDRVLDAPATRQLLDFTEPLGIMMVAVLHYVSEDDDIEGLVERYRSVLVPGSFLVVSHTTADDQPEAEEIRKIFAKTPTPVTHRSHAEITALFKGLDLVPPGVVWTPQWHPIDDTEPLYETPERSATYAAVGRVP
jgi:hypothetical protein